jgi:pyridoxamine 5'-phosphate oxidase
VHALPAQRQGHEGHLTPNPLRRVDLDPDPVRQFDAWFVHASAAGVEAPEAMALATADADGRPSLRMVLLRGHGPDGFRFYTGYESRKGRELEANPQAALLWHWAPLGRQVRAEGRVHVLSAPESDAYYDSRPADSRLGAWASDQSTVIASREVLDEAMAAARSRFAGGDPPRPARWGGFRLEPRAFEFWQHGPHRLHDRFRYTPDGGGWRIERLAP